MNINWKTIDGFNGNYQVSDCGEVRSLPRVEICQGGARNRKGTVLKQKVSSTGYLTVHLQVIGEKAHPSVHRLVAIAFIPNPENKETVNHKDGDKTNNSVSNLEWNTHKEQMRHAVDNNLTTPRGNAKFSPSFKKEVLDHYNSTGCSIRALSILYGISNRTAGRIVNEPIDRPHLKIKDSDIADILLMRTSGCTLKSIATKYGVGISQIHRITNLKSRNLEYERN